MNPGLAHRLRVVVITDDRLAAPRSALEVVRFALSAGAPAVQLRNKGGTARDLVAIGQQLRRDTRAAGALLFVNDRLDIALAVEADGVHLGPEDLPVSRVRALAPPAFLIGCSADDPEIARRAVEDGADYIGCGAVYATSTKPDAGVVIGLEGLSRVAHAVNVPVVAIGGITSERAQAVASAGAQGLAVVGAVMGANDVVSTVVSLMAPWVG